MNPFPWLTVLTLIPLVGGAVVIGLDEAPSYSRDILVLWGDTKNG